MTFLLLARKLWSVFDSAFACYRLKLAALHYNENCSRPALTDDEGNVRVRVSYLKYKGGRGTARTMRAAPTFG